MRGVLAILLFSAMALGQQPSTEPNPAPASTPSSPATPNDLSKLAPAPTQHSEEGSNEITIPAGSKIPLTLKQAISTKNAREGDAVYAATAFPFLINERVVIPEGTYVQGKVAHVERAQRGKAQGQLLVHFTTLIYPSGYTVMLPASVESTPGADDKNVKDSEGTIQPDDDKEKKVEDAAKNGVYGTLGGATAGGLAGGLNGARLGAGAGAAAGIAWALLKRSDVKLDVGTSIEMEVQRPIQIDPARIAVAKAMP